MTDQQSKLAALNSTPAYWEAYIAPDVVLCVHGIHAWTCGDWWVYQHGDNSEARYLVRVDHSRSIVDRNQELQGWVDQVHWYEARLLTARQSWTYDLDSAEEEVRSRLIPG